MNRSYPNIAVGYVTGGITLALFAVLLFLRPGDQAPLTPLTGTLTGLMIAAILTSFVYWLFSVHRLHQILSDATGGRYPISAGKAVWYQFIPFYNIYWMFKWTGEIAEFLNHVEDREVIHKDRNGWMLLGAAFVGRIFTGAYTLISFSVLAHICSAVQNALAEKTLPIETYDQERYQSKTALTVMWVLAALFILLVVAIVIPNVMQAQDQAPGAVASSPAPSASAVV